MSGGDPVSHGDPGSFGGYIERTAEGSVLTIMTKGQWGYALFDAGCWGYASVTIATLAPLVFVRRIREAMQMQAFANDVWEASEREEAAIWKVGFPSPPRLCKRNSCWHSGVDSSSSPCAAIRCSLCITRAGRVSRMRLLLPMLLPWLLKSPHRRVLRVT
jgi:hypothetical protein